MAADAGVLIRFDTSEITNGADVIAGIVRKVIQVLEYRTLALVHNASYSIGSTAANLQISVGTISTADYGIHVRIDSSVSADVKADIVRKLIQVCEPRSLALAYVASYVEGNGTFQVEIDVT